MNQTKNLLIWICCVLLCLNNSTAQVNLNGQLDNIEEFSTIITKDVVMPDGTVLKTDVFVPVLQDCLTVSFEASEFPLPIPDLDPVVTFEVIKRGTQLFIYEDFNGQPVDSVEDRNAYQLPFIFTRTPYNKKGDITGRIISIMGYAYALQDMRGRYSSEGVYMPMLSDGWNKNAYHNNYGHVLDRTDLADKRNGNKHEDGYWSIQYILNDLERFYDVDRDGVMDTFKFCNGSVGMFGASALGNTQYQAAAAHPINPDTAGLKCLLPIVATNEHYKYTGFQNGVLRERIVTGWIRGQIFDVEDDSIQFDNDEFNDLHTPFDYGLPNKFDAANLAIDHFISVRYESGDGNGLGPAGYYPNSPGRTEMDASFAPVNAQGESVVGALNPNGYEGIQEPLPNLNYSRYTNMDVPAYHLSGWWDIFTDGQIDTWRKMRENIQGKNKGLQKLVIGPWAHQTIGGTETGDMVYKDNVADIMGFDLSDIDIDKIEVDKVLQSELISWFRYNLNYNNYANIGLPTALIPESNDWQEIGDSIYIRIPAEDYKLPFNGLINLLIGEGELPGVPIELNIKGNIQNISYDVPAFDEPLLPEFTGSEITSAIDSVDYESIADVRFYVVGPNNDGNADNEALGNYWFHTDTFPIVNNIEWRDMYLHKNGDLNTTSPTENEGYSIYIHDPDSPVKTHGGGNMIVSTPDGDRDSQGQMNLADPRYSPYTLNHPGVVQYSYEVTQDSMCIIGFPNATVYAKTNPGGKVSGPTDTDFFVRILDVYPDGREYFVVEGCVNARGRDYARQLLEGPEDPNIPFTNIEIGQIYEYRFGLMPIAYTWGKGHKIKVLISSSNHNRYQVNPNLPIEEGEFFRRQPNDGKTYVYQGEEMEPRIAVQRIAHSPEYPTKITLPVYNKNYTNIVDNVYNSDFELDAMIYPNPSSNMVNIYMNASEEYTLIINDLMGKVVYESRFSDNTNLDVSNFDKGMYLVDIRDTRNPEQRVMRKIIVQ
ncbi:MAG: CocE/NonD family hydrolase [Chitinophagales bacterium]